MDMELMELDMQLKNKILSLMQPTYFPWLGYFNLIKQSDIFVLYNTTQLQKRSWQTRNKIKTSNGEIFLNIPIKKTTSRDNLFISNAEISYDTNWIKKHLDSIKYSYIKTNYFNDVYPIIQNRLESKPKYLSNLHCDLICDFLKILDINTQIINSQDVKYTGKKDEALISICKSLNVSNYLSVKGSKDYILQGDNLFAKNNINLEWHEYVHPNYKQINGDFISHLGIIDALFNIGPKETKKLI
tara:strand:- start:1937 stop:2665 length:729 start_codon:yes stop_codon:yes gene_type:complete